jgi:hypothetical protein
VISALSFLSSAYLPISKEVIRDSDEKRLQERRVRAPREVFRDGLFGESDSFVEKTEDLQKEVEDEQKG